MAARVTAYGNATESITEVVEATLLVLCGECLGFDILLSRCLRPQDEALLVVQLRRGRLAVHAQSGWLLMEVL
jgi:hypothetical protein